MSILCLLIREYFVLTHQGVLCAHSSGSILCTLIREYFVHTHQGVFCAHSSGSTLCILIREYFVHTHQGVFCAHSSGSRASSPCIRLIHFCPVLTLSIPCYLLMTNLLRISSFHLQISTYTTHSSFVRVSIDDQVTIMHGSAEIHIYPMPHV